MEDDIKRWTAKRKTALLLKTGAVTVPSCSMKRNSPLGLTPESMLSEKRRPVAVTTGVCPAGAQVVPVC